MHAWQKLGLLGEDLILQFVNTVNDPGKTRLDDGVPDWATLVRWAEEAEILTCADAVALQSQTGGAVVESEIRAIHDLREATWQVLRSESPSNARPRPAETLVAAAVRWSFGRAEFVRGHGEFRWRAELDGTDVILLRLRLGLEVERFLRSTERGFVKECGRCTALFLDRGRGRGRIWCRMATCGNRAKVDRFRRKHYTSASTDPPTFLTR